jgi:parallel beta-helix repeat protein
LNVFLKREDQLKRNDLVLPIYYIEVDLKKAKRDPLLNVIFKHQYADWRELRFELATSPQFSRSLAQIATDIRDAISRSPALKRPGTQLRKKPGKKSRAASAEQVSIALSEAHAETVADANTTTLPSEKSEPRVRLVDISGQGEFVSVHEAIIHASAGERIVIRPGIYNEKPLLIDKPLELIGSGKIGEVIIRGRDESVINFGTVLGRLTNLRIEHEGPGKKRGTANYALYISQGKLEAENCQIATEAAHGVLISSGADPRLRNLQISSAGIGIFFASSLGALEDSIILSRTSAAVSLASGGNPTIRRNRLHTDAGLAVHIFNNATGLFESNEIAGGVTAVYIQTGANPILRSNTIHNAKDCGVEVDDGGDGLLENNQIVNNTKVGIRVTADGNPTVRNNKIAGQEIGIEISNAAGIFEKNDLRGNSKAAWKISSDSLAKILRSENLE